MVTHADTSFLFSLYGNDSNSGRATRWAKTATTPINLTELGLFELENALRFSASRGFIPESRCEESLGLISDALEAGRLQIVVCNLANIVERARKISRKQTLEGGHRSFDILHVATALEMKAEHFLTFDTNQRTLADREGLAVPL